VAPIDTRTGMHDYLGALRRGDARAALALVDELIDSGVSFDALCEEVVRPALYEIGDLWERGEISVADEHLATSISETVLALVGSITAAPPDAEARVLVCCTDGEGHAIGARMVGETFAAADWAVQYLGPSTPPDAIARAVAERGHHVVALSTTMCVNLPATAETIAAVREAAPTARILVGGQAYGGDPARAERVGADVFKDDVLGLVEEIEGLLARS